MSEFLNTYLKQKKLRKKNNNHENADFHTLSPTYVSQHGNTVIDLGSQSYLTTYTNQLNGEVDINQLIDQIKIDFEKQQVNDLFDRLEKDFIRAATVPFGLGKIIAAYDKVGGNVDTTHNVREGIYATSSEKIKYDTRSSYNSDEYHKDENFKRVNKHYSALRKKGKLVDYMSGQNMTEDQRSHDLDHIVSANEIHNDPARILAEIEGPSLANTEQNLKPTSASANRSKQALKMTDFLKRKNKALEEIQRLESQPNLSVPEQNHLKKLRELSKIDDSEALQEDHNSRKNLNNQINNTYYTSSKFVKNLGKTSVHEGLKMSFQQAIGALLVELFANLMTEIKLLLTEGFNKQQWKDGVKTRCTRIGHNILLKWRDFIDSFKIGFTAGFISNIVTVVINTAFTTSKNLARMIREGFFSLLTATRLILSPPEGMTLLDASHEASKIIVAGGIVIGGVAVETSITQFITSIGIPFAQEVITLVMGGIIAISMGLSVYLMDQLDLFEAVKNKKLDNLISKLDEINQSTESELLNSLSKFKY